MRTIKFRGARVNTGELVYGDLTHDGGHIYIDDKRVNPDSVAQLVGTDNNGEEVYEGDELVESITGDVVHACFNFMGLLAHRSADGFFSTH